MEEAVGGGEKVVILITNLYFVSVVVRTSAESVAILTYNNTRTMRDYNVQGVTIPDTAMYKEVVVI
ncbi:hypothetical protein L9F63_015267, partial [Diploptera punctata]